MTISTEDRLELQETAKRMLREAMQQVAGFEGEWVDVTFLSRELIMVDSDWRPVTSLLFNIDLVDKDTKVLATAMVGWRGTERYDSAPSQDPYDPDERVPAECWFYFEGEAWNTWFFDFTVEDGEFIATLSDINAPRRSS